MTNDEKLMQQALDALDKTFFLEASQKDLGVAAEALRARLATPEPEPVAWDEVMQHYCYLLDNLGDIPIPNFEVWADKQYKKGSTLLDENNYFRTAPPQRECEFCGKVAKP